MSNSQLGSNELPTPRAAPRGWDVKEPLCLAPVVSNSCWFSDLPGMCPSACPVPMSLQTCLIPQLMFVGIKMHRPSACLFTGGETEACSQISQQTPPHTHILPNQTYQDTIQSPQGRVGLSVQGVVARYAVGPGQAACFSGLSVAKWTCGISAVSRHFPKPCPAALELSLGLPPARKLQAFCSSPGEWSLFPARPSLPS